MSITAIRAGIVAAGIVLTAMTATEHLDLAALASASPQDPPCASVGPFCVDPSNLGPPPKDAIEVHVHQSPFSASIDVRNTSKLDGNCTYDAHPTNNPLLPPVHRDFHLNAGNATNLDFPAPPPGATYHLAISCHGMFDGKEDQFGHFEQDVTGSL